MSLRTFHIIFITCSIILAIVFGGWAMISFKEQQSYAYLFSAGGSFTIAFGLIIYEMIFIRKVKS